MAPAPIDTLIRKNIVTYRLHYLARFPRLLSIQFFDPVQYAIAAYSSVRREFVRTILPLVSGHARVLSLQGYYLF